MTDMSEGPNVSDERQHCEAVARGTLDKWATKTHPDGVYHFVAWADIADLIERERAVLLARAEAAEELLKRLERNVADYEHRITDYHKTVGKVCGQSDAFEVEARDLRAKLAAAEARVAELEAELNNPQTVDFVQAVRTEAAHQRARWTSAHDAGKTPEDWYWLLGYLGGKALREDGGEKRLHRIIAAAAACANWYLHASGEDRRMRPGIALPAGEP